MANLYLLDKAAGQNALPIAALDQGSKVVLIQDGVYLSTDALLQAGNEVYAIGTDVQRRGLSGSLPAGVKVIDYAQLVDLIFTNKVINFA